MSPLFTPFFINIYRNFFLDYYKYYYKLPISRNKYHVFKQLWNRPTFLYGLYSM